ncbi:hypothetical protein HYT05_04030 [Candidatus Kaiserbacteria bacterium]|nr:hypothetical protein [Candidatus Kaiserbacteria bacterium]
MHQEGTIKIEIERPPTIAMLRDMLRERVFIGATLAILFVTTASVMFYARQVRAEAFLHPQACLGGWDNPAAAAGWPDVEDGDAHTYSGTNAASVSDTLAEIFCGGFSGDMPLDTKPTALRIEFSWVFVSRQSALQVSTAPIDLATSTSVVLDAAPESVGIATSSEVEAASDTASTAPIPSKATTEAPNGSVAPEDDSSPSTEIVTPENTTPPQDAPAAEAPPSSVEDLAPAPPTPTQETPPPSELPAASEPSTIQGLMKWLLPRIAYAQEDVATTTATTSVQSEISTSTVSMTQDAVLEISYTLDGSTWHVLGTVTKDTFDTRSFAIPLDGIAQWSDLSKLQISVRSLSGLGLGDTVYLDGMSLGVVYEDLPQVPDESLQSTATTSGESNAAAVSSAISAAAAPSWVEGSTTSTPIQTHMVSTDTPSSADAAVDDMSADEYRAGNTSGSSGFGQEIQKSDCAGYRSRSFVCGRDVSRRRLWQRFGTSEDHPFPRCRRRSRSRNRRIA